jgi:hypothetical protein
MKRTQRFKHFYPRGFEPAFYIDAIMSPMSLKKPARIGVAFMGDLFGDWINPEDKIPVAMFGLDARSIELAKVGINPIHQFPLKEAIYSTIKCCPQHNFLFLTKCPWNLQRWSPFPDNCWVGVTATNNLTFHKALHYLSEIEASVKYLSLEPLLNEVVMNEGKIKRLEVIDWVIIGAQTNPFKPPKVDWVENIVQACSEAKIPIFLKDNLIDVLPPTIPFYTPPSTEVPSKGKIELIYRQEYPR